MDINLLNISELARRVGISAMYCHHLLHGKRTSEKRLEQIAGELRMSVGELKLQIMKNKNGHATVAPVHSRTHSKIKSARSVA